MEYLKIILIGLTILLIIFNYKEIKKLFIDDSDSFSFLKFKKNSAKKKNFIYILIVEITLLVIVYFYIFNDPPKKEIIIQPKKEIDYYENIGEEKTEEELEKEIRDTKSNYELMNTKGENKDSLLKIEYEKALKDLEKSENYFDK